MFVMTAKVSKTKIAAIITCILALVVLLIVLGTNATDAQTPDDGSIAGDTNDARLSFLAQYGWDVNAEPVQTQQVTIPVKDNETFNRYNELQKSQGFDLTQCAGKTATRYQYEILNDPQAEGPVYATLFVCEGKIVGGDVTDTAPAGKMRGFAKPSAG